MTDAIGTRNVWPYYAQGNTSAAKSDGGTLDKNDFLKILITQLANQDPMQPMQDREFIAQMAQFTSVEQLMNMAAELKLLRQSICLSSSLIGKTVSWLVNDFDEVKTGVVDAITIKNGVTYADVQGQLIELERLIRIADE